MQLIQYAPSTAKVLRRPLLIVPPWINKFYVLDLIPEKSFIKWCVDNGLTVFCVSWVNPDEHLAQKDFSDYMRGGPLQALEVIRKVTGETEVNAVGYCVGGTLLAITLAYMAATGDRRIASATLLTTQVDFTYAGDLKVFATTEEQIASVEREMAERGYLEGEKMATAFNLLRSNDLIWPYVVNNYLKGEAPFPFDLLYWNSDATRMPAANHSYYLRNCYLENNLTKGKMTIDNVVIDLGNVKTPIYNLATREDHIAPAKSVFVGRPISAARCATCCRDRATSPAWSTRPPGRNISTGPATRQGRRPRRLAQDRDRASGLVVARLARLDQGAGRRRGAGPRARRRRLHADRGCAGKLREDAQLRRREAEGHTAPPQWKRLSSPGLTGRPSNHPPGVRDCPVKPGNDIVGARFAATTPPSSSVHVRLTGTRASREHAPLREQRHLLEPHGLGKSQHQVHVLHRLAGGAFDEIVERRADDGARRDAVGGDADEGHVGAADVAGLRHLPERQHVHERLRAISLLEDCMQILRRAAAEAAHVYGREDPAVHRDEMRGKAQVISRPAAAENSWSSSAMWR